MQNNYKLHLGDNLATLKTYPDNHFDSIVTDPPYGIEFLGKDWDKHTGTLELYKECLRVLKPGGYMLAFSAARTYHQLASNIEQAGFEIRDQLMWLYSSGFPKAQDIGKAIQKRLGVEKEDVRLLKQYGGIQNESKNREAGVADTDETLGLERHSTITQPVCTSPIAKQWEGYKTALKPAHEPIVMARKPFKGSTIDNVLKNGLGAMNIDATRVPWADEKDSNITVGGYADTFANTNPEYYAEVKGMEKKKKSDPLIKWQEKYKTALADGRRSEEHNITNTNAELQGVKKKKSDRPQAGIRTKTFGNDIGSSGVSGGEDDQPWEAADGRYPSNVIGEVEEGYQKYFYCPKVSRKERHVGFDGQGETFDDLLKAVGGTRGEGDSEKSVNIPGVGTILVHGLKHEVEKIRAAQGITATNIGNNHPTVKPVALMDYLIKLVTPPSTPELQRKVLDPFMGSGSTGMAATALGHHFTGCELDPKYVAIAETRINAWNDSTLPKQLFG
jgi:DNA modification methylase